MGTSDPLRPMRTIKRSERSIRENVETQAYNQKEGFPWVNDYKFHDAGYYYPILMVKDFDSEGFSSSDVFMTNADVSLIALEGIIEDPVNPFTGNKLTDSAKYLDEQYIVVSEDWDVSKNNGNTYNPCQWYKVSDDIWNKDNWEFIEEFVVDPTMVD